MYTQVCGITDTGLDMDACHFWDPNFIDYQTNSKNIKTVDGDNLGDTTNLEFQQFKSSSHRKVCWLVGANYVCVCV